MKDIEQLVEHIDSWPKAIVAAVFLLCITALIITLIREIL